MCLQFLNCKIIKKYAICYKLLNVPFVIFQGVRQRADCECQLAIPVHARQQEPKGENRAFKRDSKRHLQEGWPQRALLDAPAEFYQLDHKRKAGLAVIFLGYKRENNFYGPNIHVPMQRLEIVMRHQYSKLV